jgi:hypothetical protein
MLMAQVPEVFEVSNKKRMQTYTAYRPPNPPVNKQKARRPRHGLTLILVILGLVLIGQHAFGGQGVASKLPFIKEKVSASTITPLVLTPAQEETMNEQINAAIADGSSFDVGTAIIDLNNGKTYRYGDTKPFIVASVGKLVTASDFLHQVEVGKVSMNKKLSYDTAGGELRQMILVSDNNAWNDLNTLLTHKGLRGYTGQVGISDYNPD